MTPPVFAYFFSGTFNIKGVLICRKPSLRSQFFQSWNSTFCSVIGGGKIICGVGSFNCFNWNFLRLDFWV